jgi:hypothetical protein
MPQLRAGVARCDITPPVGIAHGNWSAQAHERAEGVDLPLTCTVLAASDGNEEVIIAEWELLYPPFGDWLAQARQRITDLTGVPATHIRLSATHTHSGPSLTKPWFDNGAEMIEPYVASITEKLAGTAFAAQRAMQPARVAGGKGECKVNRNRRMPWPKADKDATAQRLYTEHPAMQSSRLDPKAGPILMAPHDEGFVDHEVGAIRIDAVATGEPIAILVNYAAHPTILSWDNRLISPDYPGTTRRTVEGISGGLCLFLQGAAGNQNTVRDYGNRVEDARWVGKRLGIEAARVAEWIETQPTRPHFAQYVESSWTMAVTAREPMGEPNGMVRSLTSITQAPTWHGAPPSAELIERAALWRKRLAELHASEDASDEEVRYANMVTRRLSMDVNIVQKRSACTHIPIEVQAMRLGNCALVGVPVEPFAELGVEVKKHSPFATTFFSGYTNGVENYLPIAAAYQEGGYEVWMSPFAPEAAALIVAESSRLLNELAA